MRSWAIMSVLALLIAVPAAADSADPTEEPAETSDLVTEHVWLQCGDEPVQNIGDAEARYATWSTEEPDRSVTEGAGCGTVDSPFTNSTFGNPYDAGWQGTFSGKLDSLTLDLHNIYAGPARADGAFTLMVRVTVGGTRLFPGDLGRFVTVTPERSATGISERITFTITDIGLTGEHDDKNRRIEVVVHGGTRHHEGPTVTDTVSGWVWGTTEVPAGLVFNPEEPAEVTVEAYTANP